MAYRSVKEAYETKERARDLIVSCINYARHYDREMEAWKLFRENNVSNVSELVGVLRTFFYKDISDLQSVHNTVT